MPLSSIASPAITHCRTNAATASEDHITLLGQQTRHVANITLTTAANRAGIKPPETVANEDARSEDAPLCTAKVAWGADALTATRSVAVNALDETPEPAAVSSQPSRGNAETRVRFVPSVENIFISSTLNATGIDALGSFDIKRHLRNFRLALMRCSLSVGLTTFAREYVRYGYLQHVDEKYLPALITAGCCASLMPLFVQGGGLVLDHALHRTTYTSAISRIIGMLLVTWSSYQLIVSDRIASVAPALIPAEFVYVLTRDIIQFFFPLTDNNSVPFGVKTTLLAAGAYGINQILVDILMGYGAAQLMPFINIVAANAIARAIVNTAGEVADELTYRYLNALVSGNRCLRLYWRRRQTNDINPRTIIDTGVTTLAARATLFSASYGYVELYASDKITTLFLIGLMSIVGYLLFIGNHIHDLVSAVTEEDPLATATELLTISGSAPP